MKSGKKGAADIALYAVLALLFIERLLVFYELGPSWTLGSDDASYIKAGINFIETGTISVHNSYPTAMIMPGMPVITGLAYLIFGEGQAMLSFLKILWMLMGCMSAYMACRCVRLFAGKGWGVLAAACFLLPNWAWSDNIILTEAPYTLLLLCCTYFCLAMGESGDRKYFALFTLSFMLALMFRANILLMAVLAAVYVPLRRRAGKKLLLKRAAAFAAALLCFILPWSIRNYLHFGAFIPISYGAGNPLLLGSYQGENYPEDWELDYSPVDEMMEERFGGELLPDGRAADPAMEQYVSLTRDELTAKFRMEKWRERNPLSFYKSLFIIKPMWMLNWPWYWGEVLHTPYEAVQAVCKLNFFICGAGVLLSLGLKKYRAPVLFLTAAYFSNLFMYAAAFASDRYSSTIMVFRFVLGALALSLAAELIKRIRKPVKA